MKRTPVKSTQIAALGFNPESKELDIEFHNHSKDPLRPPSIYRYSGVTKETFDAFSKSDSLGRFFGQHIKPFPEQFPYRKLGPEEAAQ